MEHKNIISRVFIVVSIYLLLNYKMYNVTAATTSANNFENHRNRPRTISRFVPRPINPSYVKIKPETINSDFLIDDDDLFELSKRQTNEDYGHLRFGKRDEPFEDYGHMRFGRGGNDK